MRSKRAAACLRNLRLHDHVLQRPMANVLRVLREYKIALYLMFFVSKIHLSLSNFGPDF